MESEKEHSFFKHIKELKFGYLADGLAVGVLGSLAAIVFRFCLEHVSHYGSKLYPWMLEQRLWILPTALGVVLLGMIAGFLVKIAPLSSGSGIPQVVGILKGTLSTSPIPILLSKYIGGLGSNLIGMSLGREGPSIQLGAEAAQLYSIHRGVDTNRRNTLMLAGAAAGLAAAFNAPLAATVFTMEEVRKEFREKELMVILLAALTADFFSKMIFGWQPIFIFAASPTLSSLPLSRMTWLPVVAILSGLVGCLFNLILVGMQGLWQRFVPNVWLRVTLAFVFAFVIVTLFPFMFGNGGGFVLSDVALKSSVSVLVLLLFSRLLFTCFCYGSATPGGIFLPTLVMGGMTGIIFAKLLAHFGLVDEKQMVLWAIIAMGAVLAAVTRSLLTAVLLVLEMTHSFGILLPLVLTALPSYYVAEFLGVSPIYETLLERMESKHKKPKA